MKKPFKVLRIILLVVVIFVVALVVVIHLFADRALKLGIETAGTKALDVGVSVEDVDLSIIGGRIGFKNLLIDNPPGYKHKQLLELRKGQIKVDTKSLLSDVVRIREVKLEGMNLVLEQRGISGNNLQDVISKIGAKGRQRREPSGKKLHIDNLEITDVTVKVKPLPIPGRVDTIPLKLKPIKMINLGSDNKLDTAALSGKILLAIAGGVAEQGTAVLPKEIIAPLAGELKKLGKLPKALLEEGDKILKEGTDLGKEITKGLGGLLKPKKKENEETTP